MRLLFVRATWLTIALAGCHLQIGRSQGKPDSWLDESKPTSWNRPGIPIPDAPQTQVSPDSRCKEQARPAELKEDKHVRDKGWYLVGAYQGGWQVVLIRATAGYDGMCRPRQYQDFVFVRGAFAGTLSPQAMDSRADGALSQVRLQNGSRLTAEYLRYTAKDALCCPSSTTSIVFEIAKDAPLVRPVSAVTSKN